MADIIHLLPEAVANQIAAGEVIQRPASALKEILENSVDAGASEIRVVIRDAGKTLIQVTDNGSGMSEKDAEHCFKRHATSKIHKVDDLFAIHTLGFRGEALASVAAVAQVELKTRRRQDDMGFSIQVEGSKVTKKAPCQILPGTILSVRNLFYNVPARRNFLKSNTAEMRHITEEFQRVALVNPEISMNLFHNNKQLFQLPEARLRERIVAIFGPGYKEKLIPLEQQANDIKISGYIGKPQYAKKTRGEQFFFANKRFIRHPYLNHSVENALQELLPGDSHPTYFIYLEVDPKKIDINIHPTKTEINFQENQLIYALLRSTIRQSLGKYNITPAIDFDVEQSLDLTPPVQGKPIKNPFQRGPVDYNPFGNHSPRRKDASSPSSPQGWEKLYEGLKNIPEASASKPDAPECFPQGEGEGRTVDFCQIRQRYILTGIKSGMVLIDQQRAHQRILYERFLSQLEQKTHVSQQALFPQNVTLSPSDAGILREILGELRVIGFSINHLGKNTFVINGTPAGMKEQNMQDLMENILENYKRNMVELNLEQKTNLARSMAARIAIRPGKQLSQQEMQSLFNDLFACHIPGLTPDGKKILVALTGEQIEQLFKQ
ncbi:MAG: DNA mismatch repair endonuclease MutL [Bacteroidales bacterium]